MRIQNLAALAASAPLKTDEVDLPDGSTLRIRELSVAQRAAFGVAARAGENTTALIVEMGAITDDNQLAFEGQRDAIAAVIDPVTVEEIARRVLVLSGLMKDPGKGEVSGEA